jgi:hypothetical protein
MVPGTADDWIVASSAYRGKGGPTGFRNPVERPAGTLASMNDAPRLRPMPIDEHPVSIDEYLVGIIYAIVGLAHR